MLLKHPILWYKTNSCLSGTHILDNSSNRLIVALRYVPQDTNHYSNIKSRADTLYCFLTAKELCLTCLMDTCDLEDFKIQGVAVENWLLSNEPIITKIVLSTFSKCDICKKKLFYTTKESKHIIPPDYYALTLIAGRWKNLKDNSSDHSINNLEIIGLLDIGAICSYCWANISVLDWKQALTMFYEAFEASYREKLQQDNILTKGPKEPFYITLFENRTNITSFLKQMQDFAKKKHPAFFSDTKTVRDF